LPLLKFQPLYFNTETNQSFYGIAAMLLIKQIKMLKIRYRYVSSVSSDMALGTLGEFL